MYFFDVTGSQLPKARELLDISLHELGRQTRVSRLRIRLWEAFADAPPNALAPKLARVVRSLEGEGIEFLS
jgi:hypothetical protein